MKSLSLMVVLGSLCACVSKSRFHELESQHNKTRQELSVTQTTKSDLERSKSDLEKQLGQETAQRTELQRALDDTRARRREAEKRIEEYQNLTRKFQRLVDAGKLKVKTVGGRMVVALQTDILFPSGSANLSKAGMDAIKEVTPLLTSIKERSFQIEGHTDNVPISSDVFPSNWELGAARATNVVKSMIKFGLPAERVSAAGFAETKPVAPNDTAENKQLNRRIDIVVVPDLSGLPGYEELNRLGAG